MLCASTVCIHGLGTYVNLLWVLRALKNRSSVSLVRAGWILQRLVVVLLLLHAMEVAVWAQFYLSQRCFSDSETAFYYSLVTYTTLGEGGVLLPQAWRITGGWEAMIGVLMFGWSTAALVAFTQYVQAAKVKSYFSGQAE
jgi:hypothetical protein